MLKPLGNNIIVKKCKETETESGILLGNAPDKAKGEVIGVGPGALMDNGKRAEIDLVPGDIIFYNKHQGATIEDDFIAVNAIHVFCKVE